MQHVFNRMRAEAMRAQGLFNGTRIGIVSGYDPNSYSATVTIMPDGGDPDLDQPDADTGWLPVSTIWSGGGWGIFCPPSVGDQVTIEHAEGDIGSGIITGRVYDASHMPLGVQSGEFWLVHKTGSFIKVTNDGNISLQAENLLVTGEAYFTGSLSTTGHVAVGTGATGAFTTPEGLTVTVQDGIIIDIS